MREDQLFFSMSLVFAATLALIIVVANTNIVPTIVAPTNLITSLSGTGGTVVNNNEIVFDSGRTGIYNSNTIALVAPKQFLNFNFALTNLSANGDYVDVSIISTAPGYLTFTFQLSFTAGQPIYTLLKNGSTVGTSQAFALNTFFSFNVSTVNAEFIVNGVNVHSETAGPSDSYILQVAGGGGASQRRITNIIAYAT